MAKLIENPIAIEKEIVDWEVVKQGYVQPAAQDIDLYTRPRVVPGKTYKVKPPTGDSALYITINDIDTPSGRRPIEIFVNTKDATHHQWVVGLTRMISAVFRKPGPVDFVFDELQQVFDPQGGYWDGGRRINSVVAHIGAIIKEHCLEEVEISKQLDTETTTVSPQKALCPKCQQYEMIMQEGCRVCLSCDYSTCS